MEKFHHLNKLKNFKKRKNKKAEESSGTNYTVGLREIINIESIRFIEENKNHIKMVFDVTLKKLGDDATGKLHGKLFYNKQHQFIEQIMIENNAAFSPMFTAKITDLTLTFSFVHINQSVLPLQQDMVMKGSFAYFTEINETSTDCYSGYQYHGSN